MNRIPRTIFVSFAVALWVILLLGSGAMGQREAAESPCSLALGEWQQLIQEIEDKVADFKAVRQTPVNKITERPTVASNSNKSIAQQVSEALQIKEDILDERRNQCRKLLNLEVEAFDRVKTCLRDVGKAGQRKIKSLSRRRSKLVDRATLVLSEVQEVQGRETYHPYAEQWRHNPYQQAGGAQPNYWQNYQQMYRRWWGR